MRHTHRFTAFLFILILAFLWLTTVGLQSSPKADNMQLKAALEAKRAELERTMDLIKALPAEVQRKKKLEAELKKLQGEEQALREKVARKKGASK